ncbi:MAG: L-histidine N(alpha)-methyltransferase [Gammaproteobacteria bacterium]|nr:L-histidine N(alpha)-methyltransferase [Gammaproteobacteria bacterium]MBT5967515.1 L-histidine N(alpha)-methyltransferase [Gammaproteobacteria bacterium]MBT6419822.1 L-histidine N(alpha)-methyltransferase [Gammaproteobacteria bacterium]MBT6575603.1 L-histidine N(alpha)-methyltransferase [Gammaproteobacteria bacterium]
MKFQFHDYQPEFEDLPTAVEHGLSQSPKQLHPKFFYDKEGSSIFEQICEQPEYYLPNVERSICEDFVDEIIACLGEACHIIEPGAGSSHKIRFLLDRINPAMYVPMDISAEHLRISAQKLAEDYPDLPIHAICVDHTKPYELPTEIPADKRVFFYPGSSLGNFDPVDAIHFLQDLQAKAGKDGALLIGIDTKKPAEVLNLAYNDATGMTAAFNMNLLKRIQSEMDSELDTNSFTHHAFYNIEHGRIEMHLRSHGDQKVRINDSTFDFQSGESIHTENSYKYTPVEFMTLAKEAGWQSERVWQDENGYFSVHFLRVG